MSRLTNQMTVGTTAVLLNRSMPSKASLAVRNLDSSAAVYLGGPSVSETTGFVLRAGEVYSEAKDEPDEPLYAVVASGSVTVAIAINGS